MLQRPLFCSSSSLNMLLDKGAGAGATDLYELEGL